MPPGANLFLKTSWKFIPRLFWVTILTCRESTTNTRPPWHSRGSQYHWECSNTQWKKAAGTAAYSQLDILVQRDRNGPQHTTRHCRITRWQHSTEIKSSGHFMALGEISKAYLHRLNAAMITITMPIYSNFNILTDQLISMQKIQHNLTDSQPIRGSTSLSHFHISLSTESRFPWNLHNFTFCWSLNFCTFPDVKIGSHPVRTVLKRGTHKT